MDHEEIYLEPLFSPETENEEDWYDNGGRSWCQEDVWHPSDYDGIQATRYIRADKAEQTRKQIKAQGINEFVCSMIGALESGFIDRNTASLSEIHRVMQNYCADNLGVHLPRIEEQWGQDVAELCGLSK